MFFKNKTYKFKGPFNTNEQYSLEKNFKFQVKVLLFGSHAPQVIAALGLQPVTEKNGMYALRYVKKGTVTFKTEMNAKSQVDYQETRKKKNNQVVFNHDDKFTNDLSKISTSVGRFKKGKSNFHSKFDTLIVIAGKDKQEENTIEKDLEEKYQAEKIVQCHIVNYPEKKGSWSVSTSGNIPNKFYHMMDTFNAKSLAESIKDDLAKFEKQLLNNMGDEFIEHTKQTLIDHVKNDLHTQADDYFLQQKGCCM